jgi:hypothetical protein
MFKQLCVWPGIVLEDSTTKDLEDFFMNEMGVRIKYHTEIQTYPDLDSNGSPIEGTGGRNDLFFFVHAEDINKFSVRRLGMGIRWWEDVISYNKNSQHLYPQEFIKDNPPTW